MTSTANLQNFKHPHFELDPNKILFETVDGEKIIEEWKDIPDYEGFYQCSTFGRIKSISRRIWRKTHYLNIKERIISISVPQRYVCASLSKNGYRRAYQVHQLVAITFKNHKPNGFKLVVDHKDNNPLNNHIDNLQIVTNRYNSSKDQKGHTSKYTGVSFHTKRKKWRSAIYHNGKEIHLGYFTNQKEASKYYQDAVKAIREGTEIKIKRKTPTSKHKGIYKKKNRWALQIDGQYIASFKTEEEAVQRKTELLKPVF